ncbi:hypothetical protein PIB30_006107 [Stylosanthes scabra]|uniref:Uncharacterized protein n=1 Tax=Stylosanthes scabra TaxID=79078 RepID=A0ABU6W5Z2_9FABA|nr:hypothetical protein [Stylosanthes scabra]
MRYFSLDAPAKEREQRLGSAAGSRSHVVLSPSSYCYQRCCRHETGKVVYVPSKPRSGRPVRYFCSAQLTSLPLLQ